MASQQVTWKIEGSGSRFGQQARTVVGLLAAMITVLDLSLTLYICNDSCRIYTSIVFKIKVVLKI